MLPQKDRNQNNPFCRTRSVFVFLKRVKFRNRCGSLIFFIMFEKSDWGKFWEPYIFVDIYDIKIIPTTLIFLFQARALKSGLKIFSDRCRALKGT